MEYDHIMARISQGKRGKLGNDEVSTSGALTFGFFVGTTIMGLFFMIGARRDARAAMIAPTSIEGLIEYCYCVVSEFMNG